MHFEFLGKAIKLAGTSVAHKTKKGSTNFFVWAQKKNTSRIESNNKTHCVVCAAIKVKNPKNGLCFLDARDLKKTLH